MFDAGALAEIFGAEQSSLGVITDGHSIAADAANHQTLKKCGPFPWRTLASVRSPTLGGLAESLLVLLVFFPRDVSRVGVGNQRIPLILGQPLYCETPLHCFLSPAPAKHERTGVAWIMQDA